MGELGEVRYQFEEPFVIDASDTEETFGLSFTPFQAQLEATSAGYRFS